MFSPEFELSNSNLPGSKNFYTVIQEIGKHKIIPKGKILIRMGSHATTIFYVKKGAFKTVVRTAHKDYILAFTFEDDIECCPSALMNNHTNNFDVLAITNSEVISCEIEDFKKYAGAEECQNFTLSILRHYSIFLENQIIASLSLTAEERYRRLLLQQPEKIKQIPLSLIASYLGITIERLSRIRKKLRV